MGKCTLKLFGADREAKNGLKRQITHNATKTENTNGTSLDTKRCFDGFFMEKYRLISASFPICAFFEDVPLICLMSLMCCLLLIRIGATRFIQM